MLNNYQPFKFIQKALRNKSRVEGEECQKVLGNKSTVKSFANFWESHGEDLLVVNAIKLVEYAENKKFTPEEFEAYKQGVGEIGVFFLKCWTESNEENLVKKKK